MSDPLFPSYSFDLDEMVKQITGAGAKTVGLQLPDGLKRRAADLAGALEEAAGCTVLIFGEECFGACDIINDPEVDLVFNIGHSDIPNMTFDREGYRFVELPYKTDYTALTGLLPLGEMGRTVGLVSTIQHIHALHIFKEFLKSNGIDAVVSRGGERLVHPGQVLGCNFSSAWESKDVDCFLYLGSGRFHPLGIYLALDKPVFILDPYSGLVAVLEQEARDSYLKKRWGVISSAKTAETFGIILSRKPGQYRPAAAAEVKKKLEDAGKKAFLITMDLVTPQRLLSLGLDAYVITACPRIAIDDSGNYDRPLLTPVEVEGLLGLREDLVFDEIE